MKRSVPKMARYYPDVWREVKKAKLPKESDSDFLVRGSIELAKKSGLSVSRYMVSKAMV